MPSTLSDDPKPIRDISSLKIDPSLRDQQSRNRPWVPILLILIVAGGGLYAWKLHASRPPEIPVVQARVVDQSTRKDTAILSASGYVEARRRATVSSKITGQVVELLVEEGMVVQEGQILARLDNADASAQLASSLTQVRVAEAAITELEVRFADAVRTLQRSERLFAQSVISEEDRDRALTHKESLEAQILVARSQLSQAEAGVAIAQTYLDNFTIRAPFAGIAISKDAQIGEMISPISAGGGYTRTGISTIVDMASLEIEVDVNESYIARVQVGQKVLAVLDAYPGWEIPSTVRTVIPSADRQKATVKVRIAFDALDPRILPEMGVKVSFLPTDAPQAVLSEDQEGGPQLIIDNAALFSPKGNPYVLICRPDNTLEFRPVTLGRTLARGFEVIDGIRPGEWAVADPSASLKAGQEIRPVRR